MYIERHKNIPIAILVTFTVLLTSVHGAPIPILTRSSTLSCGPATWDTLLLFYVFNYGVHALTIKSVPDEIWRDTALWMLAALLLPFSGIFRACGAISRGPIPGETDLQGALRAGALCEVRSRRRRVDLLWTSIVTDASIFEDPTDKVRNPKCIHGQIFLPKGYYFEIVPPDSHVDILDGCSIHLSKSYNVLKGLAAIIQLIYACITLYRTKGTQLSQYGYAAFGLTVIAYAVMSLVNLIATVIAPDYPSLYMVRTIEMEKAEREGGTFIGTVGSIERLPASFPASTEEIRPRGNKNTNVAEIVAERKLPSGGDSHSENQNPEPKTETSVVELMGQPQHGKSVAVSAGEGSTSVGEQLGEVRETAAPENGRTVAAEVE